MKSAFASKRKARKIQVDEDDDGGDDTRASTETVNVSSTTSTAARKPIQKSTLRQSMVFDDGEHDTNDTGKGVGAASNRPSIGRSSSIKKKKAGSSRLSFGPGEIISGGAAESLEDNENLLSRKATLSRRVIESNAFRNSVPSRDEDEVRPTYNKDYLNELKSSTPTTPKNLQVLQATIDDEDSLDASELEGAMIVDTGELRAPLIPTEAEIREKKERRARLAHEQEFISFNDVGGGGRQVSLLPQRKRTETRLVREDEDLGEGFDEFVDDGRISLGKKQEREAKRRHRKEMADMIHHAEGSSDEESDDSEAERRAAYEAAQTRAGMDGLHKPGDDAEISTVQVPARITPLPGLAECLERLQTTMRTMEQAMQQRHNNMADLDRERQEILAREIEVQELLKQAGARYSALKADSHGAVADPKYAGEAHNERPVVDRGLESFGNTPTIRPDVDDG